MRWGGRTGSRPLLMGVLCALTVGTSGAGQAPPPQIVELDLRVDKSAYELHDRVPVYLLFRNRSADPVVINVFCMIGEPSDCDYRFDVRTPSGKPALPAMVRDPTFPGFFGGRFLTIYPGKTGGQEVDVSLFAKVEDEGDYSVVATYTNRLSGKVRGGTVWVGTLRSPARTFRIVKELTTR